MKPRIFNVAVWSLVLAAVQGLHAQQNPSRPALERTPGPKIVISGGVALASFVALSDSYLQKLADCYTIFASTAEARSADWDVIRTPLGAVAERRRGAVARIAVWGTSDNASDMVTQAMRHALARRFAEQLGAIEGVEIGNDVVVKFGVMKCQSFLKSF